MKQGFIKEKTLTYKTKTSENYLSLKKVWIIAKEQKSTLSQGLLEGARAMNLKILQWELLKLVKRMGKDLSLYRIWFWAWCT